jgi:hypothetical protein
VWVGKWLASKRSAFSYDKETSVGKLNPGIVRTVAWLNELGFKTCDSGGKTHEYECDRDHAYVVIEVANGLFGETHRLVEELKAKGVLVQPIGSSGPCIQASYDPANRLMFIDLMNVDDALLFDT